MPVRSAREERDVDVGLLLQHDERVVHPPETGSSTGIGELVVDHEDANRAAHRLPHRVLTRTLRLARLEQARPTSHEGLTRTVEQEVPEPLGRARRPGVVDGRERLVPDLPTGFRRAQAEVDVLEVRRVIGLVESTELVPDRLLDEQRTTGDVVDAAFEPHVLGAVAGTDCRGRAVGPDHRTGLLQRSVRIEVRAPDDGAARPALLGVDERLEPSAAHDAVVVEEEEVLTSRALGREVDRAPEPEIRPEAEHLSTAHAALDLGCAGRRRVVENDDHLVGDARHARGDRVETRRQHRCISQPDDDHGHARSHLVSERHHGIGTIGEPDGRSRCACAPTIPGRGR